jgi:tetratricopeptide (TPR) repeat protein
MIIVAPAGRDPWSWTRVASILCLLFVGAPATAQPRLQSRSAIVATQALIARADTLTRREQWPEARDAWRRVLAANPYFARGWLALGTVERSAGNGSGAIRAFEHYLELGGAPPAERTVSGGSAPADVAYGIASLHAVAGRWDSASQWLQQALQLGLRNPFQIGRDSTFRALWAEPRFAPYVARAASRIEGWKADVLLLRNEIRRVHAGPNANMRAVEEAADRLIADIPLLSEGAFVLRVQRMLALTGSGHTTIALEGIERWNRTLPVNFETLSDTLCIVAADSAYADLVGARILAIGGKPVEAALPMIDSLASVDNRFGIYRARARSLRWPQVSAALGLAPNDSTAEFLVRTLGGARKSVLIRARSNRYADFSGGPPGYSFIPGAPNWVTVDSLLRDKPLPLSRRDLRSPQWFTYLPETRTVYFGFNSVTNDPRESLAQFAARLLRFVDSTRTERLIIDLRANNGGNSRLLLPLTDGIAASRVNRPGGLYVLIGPYTYSAAMNAATLLERHTQATFVGEPTPSSPNFVGESNIFFLPNSRLTLSVSDIYWQTSWPFDQRQSIAPSVYLPPTLAMRRARRDAALEAILAAPLPSLITAP